MPGTEQDFDIRAFRAARKQRLEIEAAQIAALRDELPKHGVSEEEIDRDVSRLRSDRLLHGTAFSRQSEDSYLRLVAAFRGQGFPNPEQMARDALRRA